VPSCLLVLLCTGCNTGGAQTVHLSVAGSQVAVELVSSWLDDAGSGCFDVTRGRTYQSDAGFQALQRGEADLACADRAITPRELEPFGEHKPVGHAIAFYGYGLYVNVENTVDSILAAHLSMVYRGQVGGWAPLGGAEVPIGLYGPPKGSRGGELLARQAGIWFDEPKWRVLETPEAIVAAVAADPGGLGFAPLGYDDESVRYLGLRMSPTSEPVLPSLEAIGSGRYGFAKVIYVYTRSPTDPRAQAVIDYLHSPGGVEAIRSTDLHPMAPEPTSSALP
jgi:phosphate transport system substrate-binding protein